MEYRYRTEDEMKDSGVEWIGKIPKNWEKIRFGRIIDILTDYEANGSFSSIKDNVNLDTDEKYAWYVRATDLENNRDCIDDANRFCDKKSYEFLRKTSLKENDLLVAKRGEIGKVYLMPKSTIPATLAPNLYLIRINKNYFSKYMYYYLLSKSGQSELSLKNKSTTMGAMYKDDVKEILICHTDKLEQEKIANFLDEKTLQFDSIISKKEELIQKLDEAKKSLISEVVTGKVKVVKTDDGYELVKRSSEEMKDSGVEWLGSIPKDWEVNRLRFLGNLQNGISKSSDQFGFGYPFVSYSNVYRNIELPYKVEGLVNSTDEERESYSVQEGDVLFTRTSETVEEIGFASTCMKTINNSTFAGFLIRFRPNDQRLYKGFSKYYFRCDLNRKYFVKEMNLVTRASLSQNLLNNLSVVLPTYNEQVEIHNALELKIGGINLSIDKLKYQMEKLKEAKQSLISEAVTGKIEIL